MEKKLSAQAIDDLREQEDHCLKRLRQLMGRRDKLSEEIQRLEEMSLAVQRVLKGCGDNGNRSSEEDLDSETVDSVERRKRNDDLKEMILYFLRLDTSLDYHWKEIYKELATHGVELPSQDEFRVLVYNMRGLLEINRGRVKMKLPA